MKELRITALQLDAQGKHTKNVNIVIANADQVFKNLLSAQITPEDALLAIVDKQSDTDKVMLGVTLDGKLDANAVSVSANVAGQIQKKQTTLKEFLGK